MSWLFGRKKQQKDSPPDSTEEAEQSSDPGDGFVHVGKWPAPGPPNVAQDTATYPSANLYPYIPPNIQAFGQVPPTDSSRDSNQGDNTHYLNGVPFKLCTQLQNNISNDFDIEKLKISEFLSFIERIKSQNYDYSFNLEDGIVAEMNSRAE
ncbi:uncharacterized protein LOC143427587 [Xylocopa sonorina]|uniref:uncharacterized protein LOC143427587 n=1 Tax=Xylocopa sonorina TaxID=1818115 RepID=UPI00403ACCA9